MLKSAVQGMAHSGTRQGMPGCGGPGATAAVKPWERGFGAAGLIGGAVPRPVPGPGARPAQAAHSSIAAVSRSYSI